MRLSRRVRNKVVAAYKAMKNAGLNRALVAEGFKENLELLGLAEREIIFYPNLRAACDSDTAMHYSWHKARLHSYEHRDRETEDSRASALENRRIQRSHDALADMLSSARRRAWEDAGGCCRDGTDRNYYTVWRSAWFSVFQTNRPHLDSFIKIAQGGCFLFWVGKNAVHVVLANIYYTNNELHREDGPAVEYEDGSGLFFWHSRHVPREVVETDKLTVEQILTEENAELRRIMMERYGQERFICDAEAKVLDKHGDDELVEIPLANDPEMRLVALKLRCPSSGAIYVLRVPPDQHRVKSALAWTFGYGDATDYKLQAET